MLRGYSKVLDLGYVSTFVDTSYTCIYIYTQISTIDIIIYIHLNVPICTYIALLHTPLVYVRTHMHTLSKGSLGEQILKGSM